MNEKFKKAKEILNRMIASVHEQYFGNENRKKDMRNNSIDIGR